MADIDALAAGSCSPEDIEEMANNIVINLSLDSFEQMVASMSEARIAPPILGAFLTALSKKLLQTENKELQIELLAHLLKLAERAEFSAYAVVRNFYTDCLEANGHYSEAAQYIATWEEPNEEVDKLRRFLRIGEDFFKGHDIGNAASYLNKSNAHIYRLRTPKDLLDKFDEFRGNVHIARSAYIEAARSFEMLWRNAQDPSVQMMGLRNACICALISPASKSRTRILTMIMEDERAQRLDVYPMLDITMRQKFIDKLSRDMFKEKISDIITDKSAMRALEASSTQHNLSVAQHLYSSVSIGRLAQLIGDSYDNVEAQLEQLIQSGMLDAEIDQPESMVIFLRERESDDAIQKFCERVRNVVVHIPKLD